MGRMKRWIERQDNLQTLLVWWQRHPWTLEMRVMAEALSEAVSLCRLPSRQ